MFSYLIFKKNPHLEVTLVEGGEKASVKIRNANQSQIVILLYYAIKQTASYMKVDHRHLMNKLISIDKTISRTQKQTEREAKYGKK